MLSFHPSACRDGPGESNSPLDTLPANCSRCDSKSSSPSHFHCFASATSCTNVHEHRRHLRREALPVSIPTHNVRTRKPKTTTHRGTRHDQPRYRNDHRYCDSHRGRRYSRIHCVVAQGSKRQMKGIPKNPPPPDLHSQMSQRIHHSVKKPNPGNRRFDCCLR